MAQAEQSVQFVMHVQSSDVGQFVNCLVVLLVCIAARHMTFALRSAVPFNYLRHAITSTRPLFTQTLATGTSPKRMTRIILILHERLIRQCQLKPRQ